MENLKGKNVLITAGPTREFIDPVRFISNPSTGKMGIAIAKAAKTAGANVTLILGPTEIKPPPDINTIKVITADEMYYAVQCKSIKADIIIMTAAVSDYMPIEFANQKIKKTDADITLRLTRTKDILSGLRDKFPDKIIIGFAAETENLIENAKKKLISKNLDMIVANDITQKGAGFGKDTNSVVIIDKIGNIEETGLITKAELAEKILVTIQSLK
jgi:phosphopantothenoylcysteine decarboxylase / phosphopantothenate---cysteine ligase